ncbi:MAG: hypothetical protein RI897_3751 [Verrucomicrobiota bacterium]
MTFIVGVFGGDPFHAEMIHDGVIHGHVAHFFADLDHTIDLVGFAFADEVGDGGGEDQDFHCGDAAFFVDAFEEVLSDDAFEGFGESGADFILLVGWEDVDDTVDGFGGALGMECAEDEVTGTGGGEGEFDGFEVTHFADEDDIRVFAEGAAEGGGEGAGMDSDFAVVDEAAFAFVDEFDGVFDGEDMFAPVAVGVVHHGGEGGGFTAAGGAGDEDEPAVEHGEFFKDGGEWGVEFFEVLEREHLGGDLAEDGGAAPFLVEEIGTEPGDTGDFVAEVDVTGFLVDFDLIIGGDLIEHRLEFVIVEGGIIYPVQFSVDAEHGRVSGREMEVGSLLLEHQVEEGVNFGHTFP